MLYDTRDGINENIFAKMRKIWVSEEKFNICLSLIFVFRVLKTRNPEFFATTLAKRSLFVLTLLEGWTFSFHVEIREKFPPDTGLKYIYI